MERKAGRGRAYIAPRKKYVDHESLRGHLCIYCGNPGYTRDHIPSITVAHQTPDVPHIIVRACERCNQLLGKIGITLAERQEHIRAELGNEISAPPSKRDIA